MTFAKYEAQRSWSRLQHGQMWAEMQFWNRKSIRDLGMSFHLSEKNFGRVFSTCMSKIRDRHPWRLPRQSYLVCCEKSTNIGNQAKISSYYGNIF